MKNITKSDKEMRSHDNHITENNDLFSGFFIDERFQQVIGHRKYLRNCVVGNTLNRITYMCTECNLFIRLRCLPLLCLVFV